MTKAIARTQKKDSSAKKKTAPKRKASVKKSAATTNLKKAADKRAILANKLRADLKATRDTLKAVKDSARAEITVLKDQLSAAMKREAELLKIGESKVRAMVAAGEKWEKKQIAKIQKMAGKSKPKKKPARKKQD
ncbi:MAG: hypothetical protein OEY87_06585 [Gammaproteobacteria bacterium]|nr:hypothetical protein [Gammaproteobacteria bacterium]